MKETRSLIIGGVRYDYVLERKKMKNLTLRIWPDGSLHISSPLKTPLSRIETFLSSHTVFVEKTRRQLEEKTLKNPPLRLVTGDIVPIWGFPHTVFVTKTAKRCAKIEKGMLVLGVKDPESDAERLRCFGDFLDREAKSRLVPRVTELTPLFAPKPPMPPALTFRTMKTKWGVCRPREGRVTLNRNLVFLPPALADYVIYHELAHFHHADHSTAFWQYLEGLMPDCKEKRKALNAFPIPKFKTPKA